MDGLGHIFVYKRNTFKPSPMHFKVLGFEQNDFLIIKLSDISVFLNPRLLTLVNLNDFVFNKANCGGKSIKSINITNYENNLVKNAENLLFTDTVYCLFF